MKRLTKKLGAAILVAAISVMSVGCSDSVDQKRLVQLTGDKNFNQVKQAWQMSVLQEKPEDQKIYGYWLRENGTKAEATFNFENFKSAFMTQYNKDIGKIKERMKSIKTSVDKIVKESKEKHRKMGYNMLRQLRNEKTMASFQAPTSAFIRKTYYPFLKQQMKRIYDAQDEVKAYEKKKYGY